MNKDGLITLNNTTKETKETKGCVSNYCVNDDDNLLILVHLYSLRHCPLNKLNNNTLRDGLGKMGRPILVFKHE